MKLYQILELNNLYQGIKDSTLPIKTAYKFAMLLQDAESKINFYNDHFKKILEEYAQKDSDGYKYSKDGSSILIKDGQQEICNQKIQELQNLEVDLSKVTFKIEELEDLNLTISQMTCLMPFIEP